MNPLSVCRSFDFTPEQTTHQLNDICTEMQAMLPGMETDTYLAKEYEAIVIYKYT